MRKRLDAQVRKADILDAALTLARVRGYNKITRAEIAQAAGCSASLPSAYFGTINKMRRAIMSAAVARRDIQVVAQGMYAGDSKARSAPEDLKEEVMLYIVNQMRAKS